MPSADVQNRAWRSSSSGPTDPPAMKPSGVATTLVIRSATVPSPSVATGRGVQVVPSLDVQASGDEPLRPTATRCPSAPTAIATGNVNSVSAVAWRSQARPSAEVQDVGCQPG
jgi:hypothetical protein